MSAARSEGIAKGRKEGIAEGRKEGRMGLLKQLVQNGVLTVDQAAKEAGMTTAEFISKIGLDI